MGLSTREKVKIGRIRYSDSLRYLRATGMQGLGAKRDVNTRPEQFQLYTSTWVYRSMEEKGTFFEHCSEQARGNMGGCYFRPRGEKDQILE